jgi:hypothetical protein
LVDSHVTNLADILATALALVLDEF